jgi:hypothetical protein
MIVDERTRSLLAAAFGVLIFILYVHVVGGRHVWQNIQQVSPRTVGIVIVFVLIESLIDGVRFRASTIPLEETISTIEGILFSLMGDLVGTAVPAGGIASESIVAFPLSNAAHTRYFDALGVRAAADYIEIVSQFLVSLAILTIFISRQRIPKGLLYLVIVGVAGCVLLAVFVILWSVLSNLRESIHMIGEWFGISMVIIRVQQARRRAVSLVINPRISGVIAVLSVAEQVTIAGSMWVLIPNNSVSTLLVIAAIIPIAQIATIVPVPGSIGVYDAFTAGIIHLLTGVSLPTATVAVTVPRSLGLIFTILFGTVATVSIQRLALFDS